MSTTFLVNPKGLPRRRIAVRTVLPDAMLDATAWATWHMEMNKRRMNLADRAEPRTR